MDEKRAEEELGASEERYRTLYELASDAFLAVHADGEIVHANNAAAAMLGYTVEELVGLRGADDIIAPEALEETERAWRDQLEERGQFLVETFWVRKDGSRVPVAVSGKSLIVGGQQQLQLIGRDDTERKRAEEELRESEEKFRTIFDTAPSGVVIAAGDGQIIQANGSFQETLGYSADELQGLSIFDITHPDDAEKTSKLFAELVEGGRSRFQVEKRYLRKDGSSAWFDVTVSAVRGPDREFRFGVAMIVDITERRRAEKISRKKREEIESRAELRVRSGGAYSLTFREFTVLHHVAAGQSDKEIGAELGISPLTVQKHVANILSKMNAASRTEAGVRAAREGLLDELVPATTRQAGEGPPTPGREDEPPPPKARRDP